MKNNLREDIGQKASPEMTLDGAIKNLVSEINEIDKLVFGEKPPEGMEESTAENNLVQARNDISRATSDLRNIKLALSLLGK